MPADIEGLKSRAENGDASAQSDLGIAHAIGDGVKRDLKEAVKLFRAAAEGVGFGMRVMFPDDAREHSFGRLWSIGPRRSSQ